MEKIILGKNSFVITGDDKRYNFFVEIFNRYNIPIPKKFLSCKTNNDRGILGCLLSHYTLYKIAQTFKLPYLIVFEDDVIPRNNIIDYFNEAIKNVPDDWQFLKLEDTYFEDYIDKKFYNDYWFSGKHRREGSGTAAYIIKDTLYDLVINAIELYNFNKEFPIDVILRRNLEKLLNGIYVPKNIMFLQHGFHSAETISKQKMPIRKTVEEDMKNFMYGNYTK